MSEDEIPVVVVTHNAGPKLSMWLEYVGNLTTPKNRRIRPVIVDNASSDVTPGTIRCVIKNGKLAKEDVKWLYYDDVDLAFRARIKGWKAEFVSAAKACHPLPMPKATRKERKQYAKGIGTSD